MIIGVEFARSRLYPCMDTLITGADPCIEDHQGHSPSFYCAEQRADNLLKKHEAKVR